MEKKATDWDEQLSQSLRGSDPFLNKGGMGFALARAICCLEQAIVLLLLRALLSFRRGVILLHSIWVMVLCLSILWYTRSLPAYYSSKSMSCCIEKSLT